jgi:LSD1 subclass zinc finger protein
MLAAMLVECSHCGAPLDVREDARIVKCAYCDHANRVRTMHTLAPKPPPDWEPPKQWTPPPHKHVSSAQPFVYHQHRRRGRSWIAGLAVLGSLIGIAVPILTSVLPSLIATGQLDQLGRAVGLAAWDGTRPFSCGGNDSVVIEDVTAVLPEDTAITIEANCEVRIVNSTITARRGIRADGNRRVVIEKSRIQSTSTAIWADGNKRIELIDSEVTTGDIAIRAGGNVEVVISGGRVSGAPPFSLSANAGIERHDAELIDASRKAGKARKAEQPGEARKAEQPGEPEKPARPEKPRRRRKSEQ